LDNKRAGDKETPIVPFAIASGKLMKVEIIKIHVDHENIARTFLKVASPPRITEPTK